MGHIKGERREDFDRLHYPDGTHRESARNANGRELDWFDQHHREHLVKHREQSEGLRASVGMTEGPVRYIWTERDIEAKPTLGTLAEYARSREAAYLSGAYVVSESVWTCDEQGQLVEHPVKVERGRATETDWIPMEYQANGETVIHFADGAA